MWVRSEYAGEFAVVATWLSAIMPWSVTIIHEGELTAFFFWFVPGNVLFTPGTELPGDRPFWVWQYPSFFESSGEVLVSYLWLLGAALLFLAVAYSLLYYVDESRVERWPMSPVRILGSLLLVSALALAAAYIALVRSHAGTSIPLGVLFQFVFGVVLLRIK